MKEGLIKDAYELVIRELQLFLSLSYLFMIAVGMLFNYNKYAEFGINIFQYADVFDFLIAPFEDMVIVKFALASIGVTVFVIVLDGIWKRRFPGSYSVANFKFDKKPWFNKFRFVNFALAFIVYTFMMADAYGTRFKKQLKNQTQITITFVDEDIEKGILIGKTKEVLFLLQDEKVKIIPLASHVKEIEILQQTHN